MGVVSRVDVWQCVEPKFIPYGVTLMRSNAVRGASLLAMIVLAGVPALATDDGTPAPLPAPAIDSASVAAPAAAKPSARPAAQSKPQSGTLIRVVPGTSSTTATIKRDRNAAVRSSTTTLTHGKVITTQDAWKRDGNTITHEGSTTNAKGQTATRSSTATKQDGVITRESSRTGFGGQTSTTTSTITKSESGVEKNKTITLSNGKTVQQTVTVSRDKETQQVTRVGETIGASGGKIDSADTWRRDGDAIAREGTSKATGPKGKSAEFGRSGEVRKDGDAVQRTIKRERK